jgi:hypothetical protein
MTPYRLLLISILLLALAFGLITSTQAQPTRAAYLTTHTAPPGIRHIEYGETIQGDLADLGYFEFFGTYGDIIVIRMESSDFTPYLLLEDIYGAAMVSGKGAPISSIGPQLLRQSGNFRLTAGRRESVTQGTFTLHVEKIEPLPFAYGDTIEVEFAESDTAKYFSFEGGILDTVNINVIGDGALNTRVRLREVDDSDDFATDERSNPRLFGVQLPHTNQYLLTLESASPGVSGVVTLSLEGIGITRIDETPQIFTLNAVRSQVILPFEVTAGEQVQITVKVISGSAEGLKTLLTQDGHTFAESRGSNLSEVTLAFTAPYTTTVNIILDSLIEVRLEVTLERLP